MSNSDSRDIYLSLVENSEQDSWLLGLLSFAVFEERRFEWMEHFEDKNGKPPTEDDIKNWYAQQPNVNLLRARSEAEHALELYAQEIEEEIILAAKTRIEGEIIVNEIRSLKNKWVDFSISLGAGLCSSIIFAAILIILAVTILSDISPTDLVRPNSANEQTEE